MCVFEPACADGRLVGAEDARQLVVAEARALERQQQVGGHVAQPDQVRRFLELDDLRKLLEEPRVDLREVVDGLDRPAPVERFEDRPHPAVGRHDELLAQRRLVKLLVLGLLGEESALPAELERADALEERLLERAADGHRLAHRLHLRGERRVGLGKLLEVPARNLHDDVVDRRLEAGRCQPRDVVRDLVAADSRGPAWRRSWRSESRWPWTPAPTSATRAGSSRCTIIRPSAGFTANWMFEPPVSTPTRRMIRRAASRIRWYSLSDQRERRRNRDAVAGVHAHRVDVLDRADDDEVVGASRASPRARIPSTRSRIPRSESRAPG